MKISAYFISNGRADTMKTEILFRIATARADGSDLIRFDISGSEDERDQIIFRCKKILKAAKNDGTIKLFAFEEDFEKKATEAEYLLNLYPEIAEKVEKTEYSYFYLKI